MNAEQLQAQIAGMGYIVDVEQGWYVVPCAEGWIADFLVDLASGYGLKTRKIDLRVGFQD